MIEQFIYVKMPPHLKKSINQAHLENGTYEQFVSHLEREWELNGLEAPDEMQLNTVMQQDTQQNSEKPKPTCHHCKKPGHYRNQCLNSNERKSKSKTIQIVLQKTKTKMVVPKQTLTPTIKHQSQTRRTIQIIRETEDLNLSFYPVRHVAEQTTPQRCYLGANSAFRPPPRNRRPEGQNQAQHRNTQNNLDGNVQAAAQPLN